MEDTIDMFLLRANY